MNFKKGDIVGIKEDLVILHGDRTDYCVKPVSGGDPGWISTSFLTLVERPLQEPPVGTVLKSVGETMFFFHANDGWYVALAVLSGKVEGPFTFAELQEKNLVVAVDAIKAYWTQTVR